MSVYAFIVGIDKYDQPGWDVSGPCTNALAIAEWLLSIRVPAHNVFLFLQRKEALDEGSSGIEAKGVRVMQSADWTTIDTFWRNELAKDRPADSRLLVYWSGHGFTENDGSRIFSCRDYTDAQLQNRVFNASNFLRHLRGDKFQCFSEQIFLADVCANYTGLDFTADKHPPKKLVSTTGQCAYFATPEGQYARGSAGLGVFTETVLAVLSQFKDWPAEDAFVKSLEDAFRNVGQTPFRVSGHHGRAQIPDHLVGSIPAHAGSTFFRSVVSLLSSIELPDTVFRPHYLRTVNDLGEPELAKAQGLSGMVGELASLRDAALPDQVPYGLIQFLVRLCQEKELGPPIEAWLKEHIVGQGNAVANARKKIEGEKEVKILIVEVMNDEKEEISGFEPFLRTHDLRPVPGFNFESQDVKDWNDFGLKLLSLIEYLRRREIRDFEIHFLVNPPLFDQPFHMIPTGSGTTLGEKFVVLLRHRDRVRFATAPVRDAWRRYAEALRPNRPSQLKLIGIPAPGCVGALLPNEKGLCYTNFVVQPASSTGAGSTKEKELLLKLMRMGVPYLYWLHSLPQVGGLAQVETSFTDWLKDLATLDQFPNAFTQQRFGGNEFALRATLLWDDPQYHPFLNTGGVNV